MNAMNARSDIGDVGAVPPEDVTPKHALQQGEQTDAQTPSRSYTGLLFDQPNGKLARAASPPTCFADLNLDQVVAAIIQGYAEYDLAPFFFTPLHDAVSVRYRQNILHDFEREAVFACITAFAGQMREMRQRSAQTRKLHNQRQREWWLLHAVKLYHDAVSALASGLAATPDELSAGLQTFNHYLTTYCASATFARLATETDALLEDLASVRYCVHIQGPRVTVSAYTDAADYSAEVTRTFARFQQGAVKDYRVKLSAWPELDGVEARTLEIVAQRLYPEVFHALADYYARHQDYLDTTIAQFDREAHFYLAYLAYIKPLRATGLPFCSPDIAVGARDISVRDTFDLALASKLVASATPVVTNDVALNDPERIIVVTGPNQGGKTTFARAIGQLNYLASLGLLIPGRAARLALPDQIFTHFEREEDPAALQGKLEDELVRIHAILTQATGASFIIMNESFSSTTLQDALLIGERVLRRIIALDALCVYITFMDELASLDQHIVSMVSAVVPENTALRTFKITRQPANGLAYAEALAVRYGLTYEALRQRIASASDDESEPEASAR